MKGNNSLKSHFTSPPHFPLITAKPIKNKLNFFFQSGDDSRNCAGLCKSEDEKPKTTRRGFVDRFFLPLSLSLCVCVSSPFFSMCDIDNVINSPATFQVTNSSAPSSLCPDRIAVSITRLFLGYYLGLWYGTWWEAWNWYKSEKGAHWANWNICWIFLLFTFS